MKATTRGFGGKARKLFRFTKTRLLTTSAASTKRCSPSTAATPTSSSPSSLNSVKVIEWEHAKECNNSNNNNKDKTVHPAVVNHTALCLPGSPPSTPSTTSSHTTLPQDNEDDNVEADVDDTDRHDENDIDHMMTRDMQDNQNDEEHEFVEEEEKEAKNMFQQSKITQEEEEVDGHEFFRSSLGGNDLEEEEEEEQSIVSNEQGQDSEDEEESSEDEKEEEGTEYSNEHKTQEEINPPNARTAPLRSFLGRKRKFGSNLDNLQSLFALESMYQLSTTKRNDDSDSDHPQESAHKRSRKSICVEKDACEEESNDSSSSIDMSPPCPAITRRRGNQKRGPATVVVHKHKDNDNAEQLDFLSDVEQNANDKKEREPVKFASFTGGIHQPSSKTCLQKARLFFERLDQQSLAVSSTVSPPAPGLAVRRTRRHLSLRDPGISHVYQTYLQVSEEAGVTEPLSLTAFWQEQKKHQETTTGHNTKPTLHNGFFEED